MQAFAIVITSYHWCIMILSLRLLKKLFGRLKLPRPSHQINEPTECVPVIYIYTRELINIHSIILDGGTVCPHWDVFRETWLLKLAFTKTELR